MSIVSPERPAVLSRSTVHPTPCPAWCKDRNHPTAHNSSTHDTAHRSPELLLTAPGINGPDVIVRAELFRLDELDSSSEEVIYVQGEGQREMSGPELDVFIAQAQGFVDSLRVLRGQLG
ncbi:DUF6907 domain-containing protein [Streptomyces sp. NPDC058653]|uniref:DUF6907 domain-containing protein n=1 Tax=Streptomyces sp. NPDC058653 TaxID=3346576 RepID=UPI00364A2FCB